MSIDVLLINPRLSAKGINEAIVEPPLGILYIASFLESKEFSCEIIDANAMSSEDSEIIKKVIKMHPLLVGISTNAFSYNTALKYAKLIRKNISNVVIVLGGPQPTSAPELCLENKEIDGVICGEGELVMYEILENLKRIKHPFKDVKGTVYKENAKIIRNPFASRITDLNTLPFPAYHLLPSLKYYRSYVRKEPFMGIITSRGCSYQCTFCSKDVFGNKVIFRSPDNILSELEFLIKNMHIRQIDILDDNFSLDKNRCKEICELIINKSLKVLINLQSGVRADNVDKELIQLFKRAGVFKIAFGVESGDEDILKEIKKNINLKTILKANQWAREAGMITIGYFMIGLPYDTPESLQKTINFSKKMNPHIANFMMTMPFYGTPLYRLIEEKGKFLIDAKHGVFSGFYGRKAYFEFGNLKRETIEYFYSKAYRDFYFRINKIIDIFGTLRSGNELHWLISNAYSVLVDTKKQIK